MSAHPIGRSSGLTRAQEAFAEALAERVFGFDDGPMFYRGKARMDCLDEFAHSEKVLEATWRFAQEIDALWKADYPKSPSLQPAGKKSTLRRLPEFQPPSAGAAPAAPAVPIAPPVPPAAAPSPPVGSAPIHPAAKAGAIPSAPSGAPSRMPERQLAFSVPNAKAGTPYRGLIEGKDDAGRPVRVTEARLPADLGLAFDAASGELQGTPLLAGDHSIALQWQSQSTPGVTGSGKLMLIVNANPRDLWKNLEVDPSLPYQKPNEASQLLEIGGARIAAGSKRGRSHAHAGTCRDDDFFIAHDAASGWSVLLVADGAGSAKSSREGARLAAEKAGGHLHGELAADEGQALTAAVADWERDAAAGARPLKDRLYTLFGKAAWAALRAIEDEAATQSAAVKDYSTTLLCALHRRTAAGTFVASFWIGDGAICAYGPTGSARLMGKPDSGEFAGQTRFLDKATLSDSAALWSRIEFDRIDAPTALILMTDGISDPRFETDNGLADPARWDALWAELLPLLSGPAPEQALVDWMDFFTPGHHDDRTLALLW